MTIEGTRERFWARMKNGVSLCLDLIDQCTFVFSHKDFVFKKVNVDDAK